MKQTKIFCMMALAAMTLLATSCAQDEPGTLGGDKVMVHFTAQLPGYIDSRAIAEGEKANELFFWVYDENKRELQNLRQHNIAFNATTGMATVDVPLTPGHKYSFAFWAQSSDCKAYNTNNADCIEIAYWPTDEMPEVLANDENRDAFYARVDDVEVSAEGESINRTIKLQRPLSQLNYGISPASFQAMKDAGVDLTDAKVKVTVSNAYMKFGLLAGGPIEMEDNCTPIEFEYALTPPLTEKLKKIWYEDPVNPRASGYRDYIWLSFNYFLTTVADPSLIDTSIEIITKDNQHLGPFEFSSKPVQGNNRTNIVTDFMLEDVKFNVVIDQNFDDYDHVVNLVSYQNISPSQLLTLNDPTGNYIVNGNGEEVSVNAPTAIRANNLVLNNVVLKSEGMTSGQSPFIFETSDLTMSNVNFEGAVSGSTDVMIVRGSQAKSITVKDCNFNTTGIYNAIYIDNTPNLNSVNINHVNFATANSNNAITVGSTLPNAMIVVENCNFEKVSNAMRMFNRTAATGVGLTVKDCVCKAWESTPQYAGFFIFEGVGVSKDANLFSPDKVTVTIDNVTGPNGKITFADPKDGAYQGATANPNQAYYVYYHTGGMLPYGDGSQYPKFIFK